MKVQSPFYDKSVIFHLNLPLCVKTKYLLTLLPIYNINIYGDKYYDKNLTLVDNFLTKIFACAYAPGGIP